MALGTVITVAGAGDARARLGRELALKLGGASGTWANAVWTTCTIGGAVVKMTSYHSMATDVKNAGANWVDREVVVDQGA